MASDFEKKPIVPILEWIFGIIFIIYALFSFSASTAGAVLMLAGGIFILPAVRKLIDKKFNVKFYGWLKWVIFIVLVGLGAGLVR
jgi:uncharacterized membrane protein YjjP (DUF1212 family)